MVYFIPDENLWEEVKTSVKPVKRKVKQDVPKRLRVIRSVSKAPQMLLDLHGKTIQEAFENTSDFIKRARCLGLKEITVITGRGTTGKALIKNEFEGWLDNPKISSHVRMHQWQNRGGAVKISLKKKSN